MLHDPASFEGFHENALRNHKRNLQGGDVLELQTVTIDGCLFENNRHGPNTELTKDGMIHISDPSNELIVINTIFRNNSFAEPVDGVRTILLCIHTMDSLSALLTKFSFLFFKGNGFAVGSIAGAKVSFRDTCFMDNEFIGSGVVVVEGTAADLVETTNVYGDNVPELECQFASIGFKTCVEFDRTTCSASSAFHQAVEGAPVAAPVSVTPLTGNNTVPTSGSYSIQMGLSIAVSLVSLVFAL